jgi:DNA-binding NarL/FixJ family response regulator
VHIQLTLNHSLIPRSGLSGAEVTTRLTSCDPPHRVLVLSMSASEADVTSALRAGASGYLLKEGPVEAIMAGIAAGESRRSAKDSPSTRAPPGTTSRTS